MLKAIVILMFLLMLAGTIELYVEDNDNIIADVLQKILTVTIWFSFLSLMLICLIKIIY